MKYTLKLFLVFILAIAFNTKLSAANKKGGTNPEKPTANETTNESDTTIKNNIVIFRIISPNTTTQNNNNSGNLKKAGKLARTSTSPHTSIDDIIYKKRGI